MRAAVQAKLLAAENTVDMFEEAINVWRCEG
jgi:hypothetical protein